ncbi:MAG: hypothetical protein KDC84_04370 [Crocinitomicaceae bacterium]|nr:hypothetical protein [Crocinitomicaceae bacterium]
MSNKASSSLFELVKSLTKSEKRYFKVLSSKHVIGNENKYIQLFDFIDSMEEYDEEIIMDHFKGEPFLNKFSITKARLYDHILNSLEQFHATNSVDAQLYKLLNSSEILQNKSLYGQTSKILRSAEKLALKHNRYALLMDISLRKKKLLESLNYSGTDNKELEKLLQEDGRHLAKLKNYVMMWNLKSNLFFQINRKNRIDASSDLKEIKTQIDYLNEIGKEHLFFDSIYLKNHINSAYNFYIGEFQTSLDYLMENRSLFRSNTSKISQDPNLYISILVNAAFIAHKLKAKIIFQELLRELKSFSEIYKINVTEDNEIKMFTSITSLELSLLISSGDFEKAQIKLPEIEDKLQLFDEKINTVRKSFMYFQLAYAHFGNGNFKRSLYWVNQILNMNGSESEELMGYTNLFNLILHYELQNDRLLPYTLKAVERFYDRKKEDRSFEKLFLDYFKQIIKKDKEINRKELFYDLYEDMQKSKSENDIPLEYFRFDYWVEAKAKNKNFASFFR